MEVITRFAPSPTGYLHLGHAYSAWTGWQRARLAGGKFLLRLEDIDASRCRPDFADAIREDLAWLGLNWDGDIRVQSDHLPEYRAALEALAARGLLYRCFCSRSEIARAASAPHGGELKYPGTCRHLPVAGVTARLAEGSNHAWRLDIARAREVIGDFGFYEADAGWIEARPEILGDVVLGRRDSLTSYHLCVVHDDAAQRVSHVTRGQDLFAATHTHVLLQRLLGLPLPVYAHHPLITDAAGKRLAKRDNAATLRELRQSGINAADLLQRLPGLGRQHAGA